jgi:SAM-dependent methyltransferase
LTPERRAVDEHRPGTLVVSHHGAHPTGTLVAPDHDERWDDVSPSDRDMITRFLSSCPENPRVLDAACGRGKYWSLLVQAGAHIVGIDQEGDMLQRARAKFPDVPVQKVGLQEMSSIGQFDGAIVTDAMENVSPEDWPRVLANLARAVRPGGPVYLTVELPEKDPDEVYALALADGQALVEAGHFNGGGYRYHPEPAQVRELTDAAGMVLIHDETGDSHYSILLSTPA